MRRLTLLLCVVLDIVLAIQVTTDQRPLVGNMNGLYEIANPNRQSKVPFSTDYTTKDAEYFDIYSQKITTVYGEVFWNMMDPQPLPPSIVNRFNDKTMALIGYEVDQVFEGDVSVPIYWSYNHHYEFWLLGKNVSLVKAKITSIKDTGYNHGELEHYTVNNPNKDHTIPDSIYLSEGNGGEYRKSFHGYPKGYAQLIKSPIRFQIQPMQIDTHNRDYNGPGFKAGLLPKSSLAPPDAAYSGLLECPCTTRLPKVWNQTYSTRFQGKCASVVVNSSICFSAIDSIIPSRQKQVVSDSSLPTGCILINRDGDVTALFNMMNNSNDCPTAKMLTGAATSVVKLSVKFDTTITGGRALITITGPANVWFGVGFNAQSMADKPYVVVIDGSGVVSEHKVGDHTAGTVLTPTQVTVVSSTVENGLRTIVLSRGFEGITKDHYTFNPSRSRLSFINAVGRTSYFSHHQSKGSSALKFTALDTPTCVCDDGITGTINGIAFNKDCAPEPISELVSQNNSVCRVQTYVGGIYCCFHQYILLDADQPVDPRTDEIRLKFRFWYQDYQPATIANPIPSHQNLHRFYFQTEAWAGEYDVPQCASGTPPQECVHQITSRFKVRDTFNCPQDNLNCTKDVTGVKILYAGGHCHAPSCISIELYNADTGALICRNVPLIGTGSSKFDELDYINIAPCLWGSPDEGLIAPPLLSLDTKLMSVKRCNNTYGHYGEMASWQMRGIFV